uniref:Venom redulysin 6 n=1 Tax=Oncocephalus sp. TaxID=2944721 RepID=A0AB38ZEJ2_9HEMI
MSKIWLVLLLLGAIQLTRAIPILEEEEDYYLDDDFASDEGGGVGGWISDQWDKTKAAFKKVGDKIKATFNKGRDYLKKKSIKVDPLNCEGGKKCKSCVAFLNQKKKFCVEFEFSKKDKVSNVKVTVTKEKADKEKKEIFPPVNLQLGKTPTCIKMGSVFGKLCMQGIEGRAKSSSGEANINFCVVFALKNYGVGAKLCVSYEKGKMKMRFKPKLFAGDEDNGAIIEAGEKEDEGKVIDPDEE